MRRRLLIGVLVVLSFAALAGCGPGGEVPTFRISYPPATAGDKPLPISLIDQTGLVTAIAAAPDAVVGSDVEAVPGRADALRVSWDGGDCDDRVTLVLNRLGDAFELAIRNHPQFGAGLICTGAEVSRALDIEFSTTLAPEQLSLAILYP